MRTLDKAATLDKWEVEFFEDAWGRLPVQRWMERDLNEIQRAAVDMAITKILTSEGINLVGTQWMKALGDGLYEFRIRHSSQEIQSIYTPTSKAGGIHHAILIRIFVSYHGRKIILLLSAYDKGRFPSKKRQQSEIEIARKRLKSWRRSHK